MQQRPKSLFRAGPTLEGMVRISESRISKFLLLATGLLLFAWGGAAQQNQKPLTNADVIKMVRNAVPASVIISAIQANQTNFDISADGLIALQQASVPQKIMDAIVKAESNKKITAAPGTPTNTAAAPEQPASVASAAGQPPAAVGPIPGQLSVIYEQGDSRQEIAVERTQMAETKNKPSSMTSLASDSALGQALQVGMNAVITEAAMHAGSGTGNTTVSQTGSILTGMLAKRKPMVTYVWALQGPSSANVSPTSTPGFIVNLAGVAGVRPDEFEPAMVKLTPSANNAFRLVGATQGKEDATASSTPDWQMYTGFLEDRVSLQAQKLGPGQYQISPASPLPPGEYAVVIRPVSKTKKFSGGDVLRNQGDGMIFDSVWSFEIPAGVK